jgi:hypothetical protein
VRGLLALASLTATVPTLALEDEGARLAPVAVSVSPARLSVAAPGSRRITLRNDGSDPVVVDVTQRPWLQVLPARFSLPAGARARLTLRAPSRPRAEPGDHRVLVLFRAHPLRSSRVTVQVRLGVRVSLRVSGRIVRRLAFGSLRVRPLHGARIMFVPLANRGNVTLELRGRVSASLVRRGRRVTQLRPRTPSFLPPGRRTVLELRYRGRLRGTATAVVRVRLGTRVLGRRYRVRL